MSWRRREFGWLSPEGDAFAERGAPMTCGGTAWLIWVRVDPASLTREDGMTYRTSNGHWVKTLAELVDGSDEDAETGWFAHVGDEGSLADAKQAVAYHLAHK
jgi:hypothetical protein